MAVDFSVGAIPPFYREIYELLCPNQENISRESFGQLFTKSGLSLGTLSQIFDLSSGINGQLNRNGLYKALALCALAQQGKTVSDKLLENYSDQELPKPNIGDIKELQRTAAHLRNQNNNTSSMDLRYKELSELDSIKVDLVPEKKGVILKHVEYNVTSQRYKVTVGRRYNDFVVLHELLLQRFPYRIIPSLPPKKFAANSKEFIESRRKSLRRFLNIIARHPVIAEDRMGVLKFFLTFNGSDCQSKMKDNFKGVPDEFMTNEAALKAKELVSMDTQVQYTNSRTHIGTLIQSVTRLRDIAERMVNRSLELSVDMAGISSELSAMTTDTVPVTAWATGSNDSWYQLKKGFKHLSVEFSAIAEKATKQAANEELLISEEFECFLTLLLAYRELCERHQKGVLHDHQRALHKMGSIKKKQMQAAVRGPEHGSVEHFESRILAQESAITNMENRNYFSLYCIQMETQLIHSNMMMLHTALLQMSNVESSSYSELSQLWMNLQALVGKTFSVENGRSLSPPQSPRPTSPGITC